jgi:hypothetical protein
MFTGIAASASGNSRRVYGNFELGLGGVTAAVQYCFSARMMKCAGFFVILDNPDATMR